MHEATEAVAKALENRKLIFFQEDNPQLRDSIMNAVSKLLVRVDQNLAQLGDAYFRTNIRDDEVSYAVVIKNVETKEIEFMVFVGEPPPKDTQIIMSGLLKRNVQDGEHVSEK